MRWFRPTLCSSPCGCPALHPASQVRHDTLSRFVPRWNRIAGRTCDANSTMSPRRYATGQVEAGLVNPGYPGPKRQSVLERVAKTTSVGIRNYVQLAGREICALCGRAKDGKPSMDDPLSVGARRLPSNSAARCHSASSAPARLRHTSSGASASPADERHLS